MPSSEKISLPNVSGNSITQGTINYASKADFIIASVADILNKQGTTLKIYNRLDTNIDVAEGSMGIDDAVEVLHHEASWVEERIRWHVISDSS